MKKTYTKIIAIIVLIIVILVLIFIFKKTPTIPTSVSKNSETTSTTATEFTCVGTNGELTDGIQLNEPIPVVWEAKLDECLVTSCHGASFTKKISAGIAGEYSNFIGYYKDTDIPLQFLKKGIDLKIYANWEFLYTDKDAPSIHNRCVPLVKIDRIEQL